MTSFEFKALITISTIGHLVDSVQIEKFISESDLDILLLKGLIGITESANKEWYYTKPKANRIIDKINQVTELID